MSERPNVVLAALLSLATLAAGLIAAGLLTLGGAGLEEIVATVIGAFTACIFFLLELERIPVSSILLVVFALASAGGLARTALAFGAERKLLAGLPVTPIDQGELAAEARRAAVRLFLLPASRRVAFCTGLVRPRVVVSSGLLAELDLEEQKAVIWHEATHARGREPLKCLLARLAASTFFWIPLLHELLERYQLVKELAADRRAVARTSRRAVAGALAQVLAQPTPAGAVGLAELAATRVDRLFDPDAQLPALFRPWRLALSLGAAAALVLVLLNPARLGPDESERIWAMVTTMSLHGLPGMLLGLVANAGVFAAAIVLARRLAR